MSVSAPVIAIDSAFTASSVSDISSVPLSAVQPESITAEPLLSGGQSDCDLFREFQLFVEWEKCSHPPSGAPSSLSSTTPVVVASSRPIYTLAPSALSCTSNPPRSDLGSTRPSTILASSRGQGAHVLPARGDAFPSQATRLHSSVARSGVVQSDNGDRSRASLSRGNFEDRDASLVSGGQSLADYYVDDNLDYDYLDHSQFGLHEPDFDTALLDRESEDVEPDDFTGSSPYLLSVQAETILCRYLGDLYSVKDAESREADSQSGGRSSVRSRLFADASLGRDPAGISLPPVFASEFTHLDSMPRCPPMPPRASGAFRFGGDDQTRFFSSQSLEVDTVAFARSLKAPEPNPLTSKDYRLQDRSWAYVSEASAFAARIAAFSTALVDLLMRADELGVTEEDKVSVHALLLDLSALNFSQAARIKLHATKRRRHLALDCLKLPTDFNNHAVDRIPRAGAEIFGGKFLEVVDSDLMMRAEGDFVPVSEDDPASCSLATGVAIVRPRVFDQPPLSQNDYLVGVPVNTVPVGGRLSLFVDHWVKITQDHFILSVVRQGFLISVQNNFPGVLREVTVPPRDPRVHVAICEEIQELIQKNAIVQIDDFPLLCLSPIFVIPKKTGDLRVILNLKKINVFIPVQHFRMETLNVILPELRPQDWAVSLDLKDAYLHVPIHPQSRRLLGFRFQGKTYVYKVLPFGLKDSPWVFSRLVATVIAHLRLQGIRIFYYLDDWLIVAESQSVLQSHLRTTLQLVQNLGFIVNLKKSVFTPQKMPVYLGASLDIRRLIARPVEPRVLVLQSLIQELVASPTVPALLWQKVLGHLASLVDLVPNCRLLMRPLQLHFLRFFTPLLDSQSKLIPMSPEIKVLCAAWASPVRLLEGKPFSPPPHSLVLTSDASQSGWGATLPPHRVSGTWSLEDSLVHINSLELKAVFLALKSLEGLVAGQSLLIRSDNTTVVSYINFQGGTHSPSLCLLAIELWEWCILRGIYLLAAHIPGKDNLVADFLSRGKFLPSEWTLNPLIFRQICQVIVPQPEIDLFASTLNFQLPKYCARCRDPQAWRVDALSFPWSGLPLYAFPPFSILPTVLEKIAREGADVALVAPFWPQRPWFLKLLSLLAGRPRALPLLKDLVYQPMSRLPHPRLESLHLTLWPLSGRRESRRDFLIELQNSPQRPLGSQLELLTIPSWSCFSSGVTTSLVTPILPL